MSANARYAPLEVWGHDGTDPVKLASTDTRTGKTSVTTTSGLDGSDAGSGANHYVEVPCEDVDLVVIQWTWWDTTISVSAHQVDFILEPRENIGVTDETSTNGWQTDSSIAFATTPTGTTAGSEILQIATVGARRCRIGFTVDGNGPVSFRAWGKRI